MGTDGGNNIDADPRFVDADGLDNTPGTDDDDLRLLRYSPCVDAADNDAVPIGITTDLDGNPRFVDDAGVADTGAPGLGPLEVVDMGAYERQTDSLPISIKITTADSIQATIDDPETFDGDEIVLNVGTYNNQGFNFNGKAITVRSTDPNDPVVVMHTIINGGGVGTVVTCNSGEGSNTILSGFVITGGNASSGGGMSNDGSSPTVINCSFSGNVASLGGGMLNLFSSPTVTTCSFSGNSANSAGGGMHNFNSSATVANTGFCDNTLGQIFGTFTDGGGNSLLYCPPPGPKTPKRDPCPTDTNGDGVTNVLDLIDVLLAFGTACP